MATSWNDAARDGLVCGSIASVLSALYLAWAGRKRHETAAPVNAISHWFFGDRALRRDEPSLRYTLTGYLIHHAASLFWGVLYARYLATRPAYQKPIPIAASAVAASSLACLVDYQCTPGRLTPGFENRLPRTELAGVYALFAVGLMVGSLLMRKR